MVAAAEALVLYAINRLGRGEDQQIGEVLHAALVLLRQEIRRQSMADAIANGAISYLPDSAFSSVESW